MIRINLLPYGEQEKKNLLQSQALALSAFFGAFILPIFALHFYAVLRIGWLEDDVRAADAQLKALAKISVKADLVRTDKKILEKKIDTINTLEKSKRDVVLHLKEVAAAFPPDQMWLTMISESGTSLRIDGIAKDNIAIARFMRNLERSSYIRSVDLKGSRQDRISNTMIHKFTITCGLKEG